MNRYIFIPLFMLLATASLFAQGKILDPQSYKHYIDTFNANDNELYKESIPNSESWQFLSEKIPFFDCPDTTIEKIYYFRWWTYRKHIRTASGGGYVVTEFLPNVSWAGKDNTISCPAAHHIYEGRWLNDTKIIADYSKFWFLGGGSPRSYSFWAADAIYNYFLVHPDTALLSTLYVPLKNNLSGWETDRWDASKNLFWQIDDRDGMESSISGALATGGKGYRATINSYMYGEETAIAHIAQITGNSEAEQAIYTGKAETLKQQINTQLWDKAAGFYKVIPMNGINKFSPARELHGYTPWYFNIAPDDYADAWLQLKDPKGFYAPFGPTTAEQRSPQFQISYSGHECQWNGPSWPYATSITLTGLANLLNNYPSSPLTTSDYFDILQIYAKSHYLQKDDGTIVPWIDENINPFTGDWISRTILKGTNGTWSGGIVERGKDYNHSTFCDLIITGLIGVRPQEGNQLTVNPLVPQDKWDYFCLDNLPYKGHKLSVLYDKDGSRYGMGQGFKVFVDGVVKGEKPTVEKVVINLEDVTNISKIDAPVVKISTGHGFIHASFEGTLPVKLFSVTGQMIHEDTVDSCYSQQVKPGIYILVIQNKSYKVCVL